MEHSKKITIAVAFLVLWVMVISTIALFLGDSSFLAYLIPGVFGLAGVVAGFYFNKAKSENILKILKSNGIQVSDEMLKDIIGGDDLNGS